MKLLFTLFITLALSFWVGLTIVDDPGLIYFAYKNHTIEMPLWFGGLAIIVVFFLLYYLVRLWSSIFSLPKRVRRWHHQQKMLQTYQNMAKGLLDLNQGEWRRAQRHFLGNSNEDKAITAINYLGAAKAAQANGEYGLRDEYLLKAENSNPKAGLSIQLSRAELQMESGEISRALSTLTDLKKRYPRHPHVLRLLKDIYLQSSDWESLCELLPKLKRYRLIPQAEHDALQVTAYRGLLENTSEGLSLERVKKSWQNFPYAMQTHPTVLAEYVSVLIQHKDYNEAESLLYHALQTNHDDELIRYYGLCVTDHPAKQLARAESMLKKDRNNPVLLLTLGRLAKHNKLWGKARTYFENSLYHASIPEAYHEMATLLDKIGEPELALEYYRQGLAASISTEEVVVIENSSED